MGIENALVDIESCEHPIIKDGGTMGQEVNEPITLLNCDMCKGTFTTTSLDLANYIERGTYYHKQTKAYRSMYYKKINAGNS